MNWTQNNSLDFIHSVCQKMHPDDQFPTELYEKFDVKRGLRNADGTGVMAGITSIGNVRGYFIQDGERMPMEGQLIYRGYDVVELLEDFRQSGRFGFEEVAYLLLFSDLPNAAQLADFKNVLTDSYALPKGFNEQVIMKAPGRDLMNQLSSAILNMYVWDPSPELSTPEDELRKCLELLARTQVIVANCYNVKRHYFNKESLYIHNPNPELSIAENFLYSVRHDKSFLPEEARLLDLCLVLHAEHGGGNNSVFACRTLTSSGTDIYSAISAAVGSLKGPRHGGANAKVAEMLSCIEESVKDWNDDEEIISVLRQILRGEAGDGSGLVYGMGHAIYTLSDPRAKSMKEAARHVAERKGVSERFRLIESVERLTPIAWERERGVSKIMCANVDLYSGFIYTMMGIPQELHTPLFAISRMVGWCAHRMEEAFRCGGKIIRPAYKAVMPKRPYIPIDERS